MIFGSPFSFVFNISTVQSRDMARTQKPDLAVGQRFRAPDGIVWEMVGFPQTHDEYPHVALVKLEDRFSRKVISVDALFDKRLFSVVE